MDEQITKILNKTYLLAAILVIGVLIYFVGQMVYQSKLLDNQNQNQVTVYGEGKIYVKPDVAVISMGITAQGATVAEVTKSSTEKMNAVIDEIKKMGVDEKDIQTINYNLTPVYENTYVPMISSREFVSISPKITGYKLQQDIRVKIRDFTKIGDILSVATTKGANEIGSLQFTIDDPEQYRQEARAKAIAKAKDNAQNLAKESGIKLGKIINVYENNYYAPSAYDAIKGMGGASIELASVSPTIEAGQQEISITVNLTYRVK